MQESNDRICSFSERLELALSEKGIQKKEFAALLGVLPGSISRYSKGKHLPGSEELLRISKILDVSMEWLMGIDTSKKVIKYANCKNKEHGESDPKTVSHVGHGDDVLILPQALRDRLDARATDYGLDVQTTLKMVIKKGLDHFDSLDSPSAVELAKALHRRVAEEQGLYGEDKPEKNTG